jgi:hypothetical protein
MKLRFDMRQLGVRPSSESPNTSSGAKTEATRVVSDGRDRVDGFLDLLAVIGILNLELMGQSGTEYADRANYGVTDPLWMGVALETLYSSAFFLQLAGIFEVLATRYVDAVTENGAGFHTERVPIICTVSAIVIYQAYLFLMDVCYWFNFFVRVELYNLTRGNWEMYLADFFPTLTFWVVMLYRMRLYYKRYSNGKARLSSVHSGSDKSSLLGGGAETAAFAAAV